MRFQVYNQAMTDARKKVRDLAHAHLNAGRPLGWFEPVYQAAGGDAGEVPWADEIVNPHLVSWLKHRTLDGGGGRALVAGCGLGDDAEELARRGWEVTAFDIAPTAIAWCRRRFPDSPVFYTPADLFAPPGAWRHAFDFIFEAYTLQSLPQEHRASAMQHLADCLAPRGTLLLIARGRDATEENDGPPWPLSGDELEYFQELGLKQMAFEDFTDDEEPPQRLFRVVYKAT